MHASAAGADLRDQVGVLYAEPALVFAANLVPNDSLFTQQWGLNDTGQGICGHGTVAGLDIRAPSAWDLTLSGPDQSIAILDTGIDNNHIELAARTVLDTNFVYGTSSAFDDYS